jgi:hypothetical protein
MIISLVILVLLIVAVGLLTRQSPQSESPVSCYGSDSSFLDNFSLRTYQPMLRLAGQMDQKFLTSAHGATLAACYRKIQRNLLREYLRDASKDFNRMYAIANAKAVLATSDPGELSMALFEQQMTFILSMWGIEARLLLDGFMPFAVDLKPMIAHLEALVRETREIARPQYSYTAA